MNSVKSGQKWNVRKHKLHRDAEQNNGPDSAFPACGKENAIQHVFGFGKYFKHLERAKKEERKRFVLTDH